MSRKQKATDSLERIVDVVAAMDEIVSVLQTRGIIGRRKAESKTVKPAKVRKATAPEACPLDPPMT